MSILSGNVEGYLERELTLGLSLIPGIGSGLASRLLAHFGFASNVFSASMEALMAVKGVGEALALRLLKGPDQRASNEVLKRLLRLDANFVLSHDKQYPSGFERLSDPPVLLYQKGRCEEPLRPRDWVAVVGSRRAGADGLRLTRELVKDLVSAGYGIVSGGALGVDAIAHQAALDFGGQTIAVLGSGLDELYPRQNVRLLWRIAEQNGSCLLSEFPPGTKPERGHFPRRNRLISALCCALVVVRCTEKSGAMNSATHAKRLSIPIFTFPGRPKETMAEGPHLLLRQGATLIESGSELSFLLNEKYQVQDLPLFAGLETSRKPSLEQVKTTKEHFIRKKRDPSVLGAELQSLLMSLEEHPLHIDRIASLCKRSTSRISAELLTLELDGWVRSFPGMMFGRLVE